jgi:hypothetical protein
MQLLVTRCLHYLLLYIYIHIYILATGVTRVVWTAVVLRCGKQMEKLPHYHFFWIVSFQKQRYHVCEMLGDRRGYSHLKEEGLDRIKWRNRFGRGCEPVIWQITDDDTVFFFLLTHVSYSQDEYFDLFHILWPIVVPAVDCMNMNKDWRLKIKVRVSKCWKLRISLPVYLPMFLNAQRHTFAWCIARVRLMWYLVW